MDKPVHYQLTGADVTELQTLAEKLSGDTPEPSNPAFYDRAWWLYSYIPFGIRKFLDDFRRTEPGAATLLTGFPVEEEKAGPTPPHWREASVSSTTAEAELFIALAGIALGEPFTWSTLQAGRMVHNVLPVRGEEGKQSGHGSVLLACHTEDGFHPNRCDYLLLFGIRNHDRVPTTLASARDLVIAPGHAEVLGQPRFLILPDDEHLRQLAATGPDHPGLKRMRAMWEDPRPVAVLFGDRSSPYLRIDPPFMRCADGDTEAQVALDALVAELGRVRQEVVIEPGSLLVVDNYLAVHGRGAFSARFDGTDRWLKKLLVTHDLGKSRDRHTTTTDRVLF